MTEKSASAPSTFALMAESAEQAVPCADLPLEQRVEAALLVADRPMSDARIAELLGIIDAAPVRRRRRKAEPGDDAAAADPDPEETPQQKRAAAQVADAVAALNARYEADGRTFRIESVAGGRQMMTLPAFGPVVARLKGVREQGRLTQAALETLAIIAYRQPILRADLESIRGVACGEVLRSLMERRFVKIVGRADEVGRPMLYGTTTEFLKQFGIGRIDDLPSAKDLR
ncbi:MAG: SMC-Scp complex subunit ScpB [Phycisphaerales bacterium]|jgi:segregation and condensation protein B